MDSSKSTWFIWVLSLLFIALFITPVFLKRRIGKNTNYYKYKEEIERKLVLDHHKAFVNSYNDILKKRYETFNLKWESNYLDPPFCSLKAEDYNLKDDNDFNKWLLDEGI